MTDMRTTRAGLLVVSGVETNLNTTKAGLLVVYTEQTPAIVPVPVAPAAVPARGGAVYLDSFLEYDGRHVGADDGLLPGTTVRLTDGGSWGAGESLSVVASIGVFVVGDVGNVVIVHVADGTETGTPIRITITGYTSATTVTGTPNVAIPVAVQGVPQAVWDTAVDVVAGLEHLEGCKVGILADNHVVGSPNNAAITIRTVASGRVALGDFYSHVYVGLPYLADLETLDIDKPSGSTLKGSKMAITRVGLMVMQSRSVWVGGQPPTDDTVNPLEGLQEMPAFGDAGYETLTNEYEEVNVEVQRWNGNGRVFVRSVDPTPATILAAIPQGFIPPTQ